jgi:hypothetical protein
MHALEDMIDLIADSDDVAQAFRNDVARRYEMMPPSVPNDAARVGARWRVTCATGFWAGQSPASLVVSLDRRHGESCPG